MSDADLIFHAIHSSRDTFARWFTWARKTNRSGVFENLRRTEETMALGTAWHYAMIAPNGDLIGRISIDDIQTAHLSGELGYWLRDDYAGQGLMTEAVQAFVATSFKISALHRITAFVDTENIASQHVVAKAGFRQEGTHRQIVHHPERGWRDQHVYGLLRHECLAEPKSGD